MELLRDNKFKNGFYIGHVDALISRDPIGEWKLNSEGSIEWKICQWCTNHSLINGEKGSNGNWHYYRNNAKEISYNEENAFISLELSAQNDYTHPRIDGEGWPHLLLEQFFDSRFLKDFNDFSINLDVSFDSFSNYMNGEDSSLHTCQFQWFFAVGKKNQVTKETEDFFWFGISLVDYPRYDFPPAYQAVDGGKEENTNKFIYIVDSKKILSKALFPGSTRIVKFDAFRELRNAFETAKANNYLKNVEFEELEIISTNIGIEMTGTYQAKFIIRSLSVNI